MKRRMMMVVGVAVVSAVATGAAQDRPAPFGIRMGAPKQTLKVESEVGGSLVRLASVPRPHPDLETYLAQATPQAGVCFVKGVGKTVTTSVYGESVQTTFNDLKTQLEGVYGPATVVDRLKPGSIWDEPNDYTMALLKKERTLMATWGSFKGGQVAPGLQTVALVMVGLSRDTAFGTVEYYFTNYDACEAEAKGLKANAFK